MAQEWACPQAAFRITGKGGFRLSCGSLPSQWKIYRFLWEVMAKP